MKTQKKELMFGKRSVVELNDDKLKNINGGSWTVLVDYINDKLTAITQQP